MIEVFTTNVPDRDAAGELLQVLQAQMPNHRINFDLEDCDRILRVESEWVNNQAVMQVLQTRGFSCRVLEG